MIQRSLFPDPPDEGPTLLERFEAFDQEHPEIHRMFVQIALDLLRSGHRRYSADGICHVIRWHRATSGADAAGFKINNVFTRCYARKAMLEHPELIGFFETRQIKRV
jgi:hypothetical protein